MMSTLQTLYSKHETITFRREISQTTKLNIHLLTKPTSLQVYIVREKIVTCNAFIEPYYHLQNGGYNRTQDCFNRKGEKK